MTTAHKNTLTTTSNHGTLSWQPTNETPDDTHDLREFIHGGYIFGPPPLVARATAMLTERTVPDLLGYDRRAGDDTPRRVPLAYSVVYPLVLPDVDDRPEFTTPAGDIVAAMIAAHGDEHVTLGDAAQHVVNDFIGMSDPSFFGEDDDTSDDFDNESFGPTSEPIY